mgnify:CR=1 FL=1
MPPWRRPRFRTVGCSPGTGEIESEADTLTASSQETLRATAAERQGRLIDHDSKASMEKEEQEEYFER